jgi:serine/threonine protein kinase, bacterial
VLPFTGLSVPLAVAVDSAGTVYVADTLNNRVVKLVAG